MKKNTYYPTALPGTFFKFYEENTGQHTEAMLGIFKRQEVGLKALFFPFKLIRANLISDLITPKQINALYTLTPGDTTTIVLYCVQGLFLKCKDEGLL